MRKQIILSIIILASCLNILPDQIFTSSRLKKPVNLLKKPVTINSLYKITGFTAQYNPKAKYTAYTLYTTINGRKQKSVFVYDPNKVISTELSSQIVTPASSSKALATTKVKTRVKSIIRIQEDPDVFTYYTNISIADPNYRGTILACFKEAVPTSKPTAKASKYSTA